VDLSFIGMSGVHAGKFMRLLASWTSEIKPTRSPQ
jgi:hypothetical protein